MPWVIAGIVALFFLAQRAGATTLPAQPAQSPNLGTPGYSGGYTPVDYAGASGPSVGQAAGSVALSAGEMGLHGAIAGIGGAGAGAGLGAGLLTGFETAGIGAAVTLAAEAAVNVFKCGTITGIGCEKRADATIDEQLAASARQLLWLVEQHQISAADGKALLARLVAQAKGSYQKNENWNVARKNLSCGSWLDSRSGNQFNPGLSIPKGSVAYSLDCEKVVSMHRMYEVDFPAAMDELAVA